MNDEDDERNVFVEERIALFSASLIMHAFQNMENEARGVLKDEPVANTLKKKSLMSGVVLPFAVHLNKNRNRNGFLVDKNSSTLQSYPKITS